MRLITLLITVLALHSCTKPIENPISSTEDLGLIPQVQSIKLEKGAFQLDKSTEFVFEEEAHPNLIAAIISLNMSNTVVEYTSSKTKSSVTFSILDIDSLHPSAYFLDIDSKTISIKAKTDQGLFYGLQTLRQLLPDTLEKDDIYFVPALSIYDYPKFEWRGVHLDVCRHFFDKAFVKKYIDQIAKHKMNTFHWHLTEDQGWRIEIKKYPLLTSISSKRNETIIEKNFDPYAGDGKPYGGYYTQDDIKEIVAYAQERFVTIVPEIEMPGHSLAALAAYPELACTEGPFEVGTKWGVFDDVYCAGNEQVFEFLENVLGEVIELFPSKYIHIGGDECPKTRWKTCSKCQTRIKEEGLKDEHELQSYFIKRMEKYLLTKDRYIIGWDEILEGGLAPQATVMSWRGESGGIEAAKQGHKVIMTPGSPCYFDHYQSEDKENEPLAIGGYNSLEAVYNYNPIPKELPRENHKYILGAQANVWTEYMPDSKHVEYMLMPRLCALSEVVWTFESKKDYSSFSKRLNRHLSRLQTWDINYRKLD